MRLFRVLCVFLSLIVVLEATGCASTNGTPSRLKGARVAVRSSSESEVRSAVVDVFADNGFKLASGYGSHMTFEKKGSRNDEWMYGSLSQDVTMQRAEVSIELGTTEGTFEVQCQGTIIRNFGGMMGEEKGYLLANGRLRFQKFLVAVKKRVEGNR